MNIKSFFSKQVTRFMGLVLLMISVLTTGVHAQDPGGNPDGPPPAVPFDDYLLPILLIAGAVFGLFIIKRMKSSSVKA